MGSNKSIVEKFYTAFNSADYMQMNDCYAGDILYSDPIFGLMQGDDVRKMWQMICTDAKDISVNFFDIEDVDAEYITCRYNVSYYFTPTGKNIRYHAKAFMKIADGKIIEHSDGYRLSSFIGNTYGLKGKLLGWSGYMKRSVQKQYRKLLDTFTVA